MNGPTPEAEAKIKSNPKSNRTATIGISHQSLRFHKKANNSLTTPKLDVMLRMKFLIGIFLSVHRDFCQVGIRSEYFRKTFDRVLFPNNKIVHIQRINIAVPKCVQCICRCGNDGFTAQVKAGIQEDRHPGCLAE